MPEEIGVSDVRRLIAEGALLVEVLPEHEYEEEHLPGALNIPLRQLTREAVSALDPARPVIVYCWDDA